MDYSSAPLSGTVICPAGQITAVHTVTVTTDRGSFPLILLRDGLAIRAFVNACPHQYLPLDYRGPARLSADGKMLLCTAHGARFNKKTGAVIEGAPCGLDPVPVIIREDRVLIGP